MLVNFTKELVYYWCINPIRIGQQICFNKNDRVRQVRSAQQLGAIMLVDPARLPLRHRSRLHQASFFARHYTHVTTQADSQTFIDGASIHTDFCINL
jgi:hypothetical protein